MGAFAEKAHRLTKSTPLSVPFNVPADGQYVVWVKYGLVKREGSLAIRITTDSEKATVGGALNFLGSGHSSSFKHNAGPLAWEPGQTGLGRYNRTYGFELKQGNVEITLQTAGDSEFEVAESVVTDDLGFQPAGIHCYRPGNPEWLGE